MELKEKIEKLKGKMNSLEFFQYLENKKREAEILGNEEELNIIKEAISEYKKETSDKAEEKIQELVGVAKGLVQDIKNIFPNGIMGFGFLDDDDEGLNSKETKKTKREKEEIKKEEIEKINDELAKTNSQEIATSFNVSNIETLKMKKKFIRNGVENKYEIKVDSNENNDKIFHLLKIELIKDNNKSELSLRFVDKKDRMFSEMFASDLVNDCDLYLEARIKKEEKIELNKLKEYLLTIGYKISN